MTDTKNPKTRNSSKSCVNRIMTEAQLRLKIKLEKQGVHWREIGRQINKL